ncbi:hypothetical protein [Micromonospora sp. WMMD710]|uniref:hypothetical protein n=1 Tax=Micromonospora sp. WMMD710 TaxID=3016085 RepID=UPI0024165252|nr:hypothetical protein [Micromonospora sp. WMMD710]MDG4760742.1 hypothetical protein [Micromonospora sp. WMMD710]
MTAIESERRKSELSPRFRVACEPLNPGSEDIVRLRVALIGPPGLDRLDRLTVTIRNDHHRRGEGELQQYMDGPTQEEVKQHVWGPYRFTPHTGPDDARADGMGRQVVYDQSLPIGEELPYQLEHTHPGHWMRSYTQASWLRERGPVIRLAFTAEHKDHGSWYLPCEIETETMPATVQVPQH